MINPIEQTPSLAYEPLRQQFAQAHTAQTSQPQPTGAMPQVTAVSSADSQQADTGSASGGGADGSAHQGDGGAAARQLGAAWSTLEQLKSQAAAALSSGDVKLARDIAAEAAGVAGSIRDIAGDLPGSSAGTADVVMQEAAAVSAGAAPVDKARAALSMAKDVVDAAQTLTHFTDTTGQAQLQAEMQVVQQAMAMVEQVAAQQTATPRHVATTHFDIRA